MQVYPLLMAPNFRHGEDTPWGGTMLRDLFLKDAPNGPVGESLEVSALPGQESLVGNGVHAGKPLSRMAELWGEALTGSAEARFPLLLKLLDTESPLSVQVHPGGASGKSKAWVILNAEPGAKVVYGLTAPVDALRGAASEGRVEECLRWENVRPGDVFYIPAGTVHALGGGIQCYEIEDSAEAAFRLWDWNRVNAAGEGRELHVEQALDAIVDCPHAKQEGTTVLCKGGSRTYYISEPRFELCRLNVSGRMPLESGRMRFLTPLAPCLLRWGDESLELEPFQTVLVPAAMEGLVVEGEVKLLMAGPSDRPALIEALGYRAENVAGLLD